MVKRLQRKIALVWSITLCGILLLSIVILIRSRYSSIRDDLFEAEKSAQQLIQKLSREKGDSDEPASEAELDLIYSDIHSVIVNQKGAIVFTVYDNAEALEARLSEIWEQHETWNILSKKAAQEQGEDIGNETGLLSTDNCLYVVKTIGKRYIISFADRSFPFNRLKHTLFISAVIGIAGTVLISVLSLVMARLITRPVEDNFTKQKQFIADASHELKTPLAVIDANLSMLSCDPRCDKYLSYIRQASERMNKLIHELLYLAAAEEDTPAHLETLDLSDMIEGTASSFEASAYEHGIDYSISVESDIHIEGNYDKLQRMTETLIDNAIAYADHDKKVSVSLRREKHTVLLEISNTGDDISEEDRARLFERFYRTAQARQRNENHSGLGLAIAKQIVEQQGGTISVSSSNGLTVFTVQFKHDDDRKRKA